MHTFPHGKLPWVQRAIAMTVSILLWTCFCIDFLFSVAIKVALQISSCFFCTIQNSWIPSFLHHLLRLWFCSSKDVSWKAAQGNTALSEVSSGDPSTEGLSPMAAPRRLAKTITSPPWGVPMPAAPQPAFSVLKWHPKNQLHQAGSQAWPLSLPGLQHDFPFCSARGPWPTETLDSP